MSILAGTIITGAVALQGSDVEAQQNTSYDKVQSSESIRPFKVHFSESEIKDLRKRIIATRWPDRETVKDETQGVQLATIQALAKYWGKEYDFNKLEGKLNAYPPSVNILQGFEFYL